MKGEINKLDISMKKRIGFGKNSFVIVETGEKRFFNEIGKSQIYIHLSSCPGQNCNWMGFT